jgi:hypothetical protein
MSTSVFCLAWRKEKKRMSLALARADSGLSDTRSPHSRARPSLNLLPYPLPPASMPSPFPRERVQAGGACHRRRAAGGAGRRRRRARGCCGRSPHKQGCGDQASHGQRQADLHEMERAEAACARAAWRCRSQLAAEKLELSLGATSRRAGAANCRCGRAVRGRSR